MLGHYKKILLAQQPVRAHTTVALYNVINKKVHLILRVVSTL